MDVGIGRRNGREEEADGGDQQVGNQMADGGL